MLFSGDALRQLLLVDLLFFEQLVAPFFEIRKALVEAPRFTAI